MTTRANGDGSIYRRGARGGAARPLPWVASYYVPDPAGGKPIRRCAAFLTRKAAKAALGKAQTAIADGLPVVDAKLTFATVMDEWLIARRLSVAPPTWLGYKSVCETWIRSRLGPERMRGLGPAAIERVLADVAAVGRAPRTARLVREVMRAICAFALERGLLARNPVLLVAAPSDRSRVDALGGPETATRRTFTTDEIRLLLAGTRDDRLGPLFAVAATTGARLGELRALTWADWDPATRMLSIVRAVTVDLDRHVALGQPKSAKSRRTIRLSFVAVDALEVQAGRQAQERADAGASWQDRGLIFASVRGTALDGSNVLHVFQRHLDRLELPVLRFHDLRHYVATELLAEGNPAHEVAHYLGHAGPTVTLAIYGHITVRGAERASDVFDRALGSGHLEVRA